MSARQHLITALSGTGRVPTLRDVVHAEQLVDAYRAEVLNEGAAEIDRIANQATAEIAAHQGLITGTADLIPVFREAAGVLRRLAGAGGSRG